MEFAIYQNLEGDTLAVQQQKVKVRKHYITSKERKNSIS